MQIFCNGELKIHKVKQMGQFVRSQKKKSANKVCCIRGSQKHNQEANPHTQEGRGALLSAIAPYPPKFPRSLHCSSTGSAFVHCRISEIIAMLLSFPIHTATCLHPDCSLPGGGNQPPSTHNAMGNKYNSVRWKHFVAFSAFPGSINCFSKI